MKLEQALQIAKEFYRKIGLPDILEVYDTRDFWVVFGGIKGKVLYGSTGIEISKSDGSISDFELPSVKNFQYLEQAAKVNL